MLMTKRDKLRAFIREVKRLSLPFGVVVLIVSLTAICVTGWCFLGYAIFRLIDFFLF